MHYMIKMYKLRVALKKLAKKIDSNEENQNHLKYLKKYNNVKTIRQNLYLAENKTVIL